MMLFSWVPFVHLKHVFLRDNQHFCGILITFMCHSLVWRRFRLYRIITIKIASCCLHFIGMLCARYAWEKRVSHFKVLNILWFDFYNILECGQCKRLCDISFHNNKLNSTTRFIFYQKQLRNAWRCGRYMVRKILQQEKKRTDTCNCKYEYIFKELHLLNTCTFLFHNKV